MAVGDRVLLDHLTWRLGPGDRIGVVGVNGSGKSSLLRLLAGELGPVAGRVRTGTTVRAAFLTQEVAAIDEDQRVLESVESVRRTVDLGGGRTLTAASLVERMGFRDEKAWTRVGDLSGGERRRLQLVRLLMDEPNVLLLDEPSNDLDIETLTALEDLLDGFAGTVVLVSHDRYVLERVCDRVVGLLGDGTLRDLPGGVEEYLALRARGTDRARVEPTPAPEPAVASLGPSAAELRAARKELTRIQRRLDRLAAEEDDLHAQLADAASDHERVLALDARLRALLAERVTLEEEWLGLAEQLEDAIP